MEAKCVKVRLKEGCIEQVREWFNTLKQRMDEIKETLKNEGTVVESVFLDRVGDDYFLIYYMRAKDMAYAFSAFRQSTLPIDQYHKECWKKFCDERIELEELLDIDLIEN